jgi:capsular polysaccharide biosynthesis protein
LTPVATKNGITPTHVAEVLWRQRMVSALAFLIILVIGGTVVLARPTVYQSSSSVALLPASRNPNILSNYPNLIISLMPTYVQLVSSPVLLDRVAAKLPFHTSGTQLAADLHAESLSNAAVINIVAEAPSPVQAEKIAAAATGTFLARVRGNGVVVPRIYGQPTSARPAPPSKGLLFAIVLALAAILAAAAGLIWDRYVGVAPWPIAKGDTALRSGVPDRPGDPRRAAVPLDRTTATARAASRPTEPLDTVRLRPPSDKARQTDASGQAGSQEVIDGLDGETPSR